MNHKFNYKKKIGYILLVIVASALMLQMKHQTIQAMPAMVYKAEFTGEYSFDGERWYPIENKKIPSYKGDVIIRGKLNRFGKDWVLNFYLNHIGVTIFANGEEVFWSGRVQDNLPEYMCGSYWSGWRNPFEDQELELEFRLHNMHKYGNANAYNDFLESFHYGIELPQNIIQESKVYQYMSYALIFLSVLLFGVAIGNQMQRIPSTSLIAGIACMTLCMGVFVQFDTIDISFRSEVIVVNTCLRQYSMMLGALLFVNCVKKIVTGKEQKTVQILEFLLLGNDLGILILAFIKKVSLYQSGMYWAITQGIVTCMLFLICIKECRKDKTIQKGILITGMVMAIVLIAELINGRMNFWQNAIIAKIVYVGIAILGVVKAIEGMLTNQKESQRALLLDQELKNNRIVLAMSQIKTHFIFNVLTAVSGLCNSNPQKADETLIAFSRYLRKNINVMQDDKLESFVQSLAHLEDYIMIEQIRFGEKIKFEKNIQEKDFLLPPLVLQPIVENAIKHGLLLKAEGGTIVISTQMEKNGIKIEISDDGVGFDEMEKANAHSIGLRNVAFRLEHMIKGKMEIYSKKGEGTKVDIWIPHKGYGD